MHGMPSRRAQRFGRRALTLVEVLVVIAIVGLLVGILVPSLSEARRSARRTQSLSNLQRIGQAFTMYVESHRGSHPFMNAGQKSQTGCSSAQISSSSFWAVQAWWPSLMREVLPWQASGGVYLSPGANREDMEHCGWPTSYVYSNTFVTRPELWRPGAVEDDRLLAPTYAHELRHPSAKVMLYDAELPFLGGDLRYLGPDLLELTPMLFADGHAEPRIPAEAVEPISLPYFTRPVRLMHTPDGVRGRDY